MSDERQQELREALKGLMESYALSLSQVGRSIGVAPSTVSMWLSGKYRGDNQRLAEAVESYLKVFRERQSVQKRRVKFVPTSVSGKMFEVARLCHLECEIGLAYGEAGIGKTMALKEYARLNPDVILIEADLGFTAKALFEELLDALGLQPRGHLHGMFKEVVEALKDSGRLLIVDEAEHLPRRALELLRRLYDKAGVGILLVGLPALRNNIKGRRRDFAQLYSRVGIAARLEGITPEDASSLVNEVLPGTNGLAREFYRESRGNARALAKLANQTRRVMRLNGAELTADLIKETAKLLIV